MNYRLTLLEGKPRGAVYEFREGVHVVGRSSSKARFVVTNEDVSGVHAELTVTETGVTLRHLSNSAQTLVDDRAVTGVVALQHGQFIRLGRHGLVLFEAEESAGTSAASAGNTSGKTRFLAGHEPDLTALPSSSSPPGGRESATRPRDETDRNPPPVSAPVEASSGGGHATPPTRRGTVDIPRSDAPDETHEQHTLVVRPEEIEERRRDEERLAKRKLVGFLAAIIGLTAAAYLGSVLSRDVAPDYMWPVNNTGDFLYNTFEPKEPGFVLYYPDKGHARLDQDGNRWRIMTQYGNGLDARLRMEIRDEHRPEVLGWSADEYAEKWKTVLQEQHTRLSVGAASQFPRFFGPGRGVPYHIAKYQREMEGIWYGHAFSIRHGSRLVTVLVEIPASDRVKGEEILWENFLDVSRNFENTFWEGGHAISGSNPELLLAGVRLSMDRAAPTLWASTERTLYKVLQHATATSNEALRDSAMRTLIELRDMQDRWFSNQELNYRAALATASREEFEAVVNMAKAVFSDPSDQRYQTVRLWLW